MTSTDKPTRAAETEGLGATGTGIYTYLAGGTQYTNGDVAAARAMLARDPGLKRSFEDNLQHNVLRVQDFAARAGIRRFLDIGAGALIAGRDTHSIASAATNDPVQVVYVDHDRASVETGAASYANEKQVDYIDGDLRDPSQLLANPAVARLFAPGEPVAVLLFTTVMHYVTDEEKPTRIMQALRDAAPNGSVVVLSHCIFGDVVQDRQEVVDAGFGQATPLVLRSAADVESLVATWGSPEPPVYVGEWGVGPERARSAARWVLTTSATKR